MAIGPLLLLMIRLFGRTLFTACYFAGASIGLDRGRVPFVLPPLVTAMSLLLGLNLILVSLILRMPVMPSARSPSGLGLGLGTLVTPLRRRVVTLISHILNLDCRVTV